MLYPNTDVKQYSVLVYIHYLFKLRIYVFCEYHILSWVKIVFLGNQLC